jgi:hypothetical protein
MSNDDQRELATPAADEGETTARHLALFGSAVAGNATFVSSTYTSLLMLVGRVGDDNESNEVVVPFVEMRFDGPESEGSAVSTQLFSQVLPLDNAAYLVEDITSDLALVCRQFRSISSGETGPEMQRLQATMHFLSDAKRNLEKCLAELEAIRRPTR